jgi:hypothetical protein
MVTFPRKHIHIDKKFGGLGIQSFSVQAESRKLQKVFGCLRSQQTHGLAAQGLLSRFARKYGSHSSSSQQLVIIPFPEGRSARKIFLDGPSELLASNNLYICRGGSKDTSQNLRCLLPALITSDDNELCQYCLDNNFLNVSDITILNDEGREWYLEWPSRAYQTTPS